MTPSFLSSMQRRLRMKFSKNGLFTIFRHTWHCFAVFLVVLAILFSFFRSLTPWVKQYKTQIQQHLSLWIGQDVAIDDIVTSWYWFTPVLKFKQVLISQSHQPALHCDQVMVGINLLSSLLHGKIQPGLLYIDGVHVKINQRQDRWRIEGLDLSSDLNSNLADSANLMPMLSLMLAQTKIVIKHFSADVHFQNGAHLDLQNLHVKSDHRAEHFNIYAKANIGGKTDVQVTTVANLILDGNDINQVSGQAYLSLSPADLTLLKNIVPNSPFQISEGHGNVQSWLYFTHGRLVKTQAKVHFENLALQLPNPIKPRKISNFSANMAWERLSQGWRWTMDQWKMQVDGIEWPENTFMLAYTSDKNDYNAYLKTLRLNQLLELNPAWPKYFDPILGLKPEGVLHDTQIIWQSDHLQSFLSRFSDLSWQNQGAIPGMTQLSGVVYWQPLEGSLELNGEHSAVTLQKPMLPINLETLNASLEWKYLSQGWRLSMDRLMITHPNLTLSAEGAIDDPLGPAAYLRMQMDFSAKDAQIWLPYIPSKGLKPKLDAWLKHDILKIDRASGQVRVVGPLSDFPFDQHNGEFSVQSHVNGVDLLIDKNWPLNADLDADIHVLGRNLVADVHQANLMDVMIHQVSISVPGIGLGQEVFLLHGQVEAPGEKIKSYVFASPLQQRFSRWKSLSVNDLLGLEINLEVPLYPESNHVFAKGALDFNQNLVSVAVANNFAEFDEVNGRLEFNEYGLTSGGLDSQLNNYPFMIRVQPLVGPKLTTELRVEGEVDISYLRKLIHHPIFSVMQGRFIVNGLWVVYPNSPEIDKLYLNSSMVGVAVNLPPPFGKSLSDINPLTVKIDFSPQQQMHLDLNYEKKVSGIVTMQQTPKKNWIVAGEVHLGAGTIGKSKDSELRISGSLDEVNVDAWRTVWNKWPKTQNDTSVWTNINTVNLSIAKVTMPAVSYPSVTLNTRRISPEQWSFHLSQHDISGDGAYDWKKNNLSAHIQRLDLAMLQSSSSSSLKWKPILQDIPNLDVTVDAITYHGIDMGKFSFKSSTQPRHWLLETGRLETPEYTLAFKGDWVEKKAEHASRLEAELHLSRLGKALSRWHVTPVVDAHYGSLIFSGKWPGAFYEGSFKKLHGNLSLILRDGHISHLDRDTEKKLGLGKLLSILSLQTIPRRLKLDFSDLAQKGYAFDSFKGTFQIKSGIMNTHDSNINGPVAYGTMSGDLDLIHQLYDLDLKIYPNVTASLPAVASIVGSPIAGVAVWAVSSLATKGMQKISGYTYKISGPWLNPVVQQISMDKTAH